VGDGASHTALHEHLVEATARAHRGLLERAQARDRLAGVPDTNAVARSLDEASLARARQLSGLKGYVTNIPANTMAAGEVIGSYHDLWHVEQSFRMSKTDLRARPMFHHTRDAIEAHLTIVFTALAISREVQARTGLAIRNVIKQLRPLRSATIAINGTKQTFAPAISGDKQAILEAIHTKLTH